MSVDCKTKRPQAYIATTQKTISSSQHRENLKFNILISFSYKWSFSLPKLWIYLSFLCATLPVSLQLALLDHPSNRLSGPAMWYSWWTKWQWGRSFSEFFGFPLSISFHRRSPCSNITWGMNNRPGGVRSSETQSRQEHQQYHHLFKQNKSFNSLAAQPPSIISNGNTCAWTGSSARKACGGEAVNKHEYSFKLKAHT
jgi:hypothetical protein